MSLYNADDESAAPTTPATGRKVLYPKADGWYYVDDAGVEHQLANSSGAVLTLPQINDTSSDHQYIFAVNELTADRTVTLPLLTGNDEFVFKDFTQALTNKTINGNTITSGSGTLTLAAGKTLTASNTLTLTATDGSTLAIGTGGTLGTAAYIAASSKQDADATLTSLSALGTAADKGLYSTGVDTWAEFTFSAAARTVLDDATVSAMVDTLGGAAATGTGGLARADSPVFTTQITAPLVVGGTATTSDLTLKTTSGVGATGADMHFLVGNNGATEAVTILNNGNVGIGTAAPGVTLDVRRTDFVAFWVLGGTASGNSASLLFGEGTSSGQYGGIYRAATLTPTTGGTTIFYSRNSPVALSASATFQSDWHVYITTAGNVGIGTTSPGAYKLNVNGDVNISGTIKTGGYTVATLPAGVTGDRAYVTDATAPTYLGALTGGGAVESPAFKTTAGWVSA